MGSLLKAWAFASLGIVVCIPVEAAQNVAPPLYEDTGSCSLNSNFCDIAFPNFPASVQGKLIRLEMVACRANVATALTVAYIAVSGGGGSSRAQYFGVPGKSGFYTFNTPILFTVGGNTARNINLHFNTSGSGGNELFCSIVGTILNQS